MQLVKRTSVKRRLGIQPKKIVEFSNESPLEISSFFLFSSAKPEPAILRWMFRAI